MLGRYLQLWQRASQAESICWSCLGKRLLTIESSLSLNNADNRYHLTLSEDFDTESRRKVACRG